jgi:hypothetical protein
MAKAQCPSIEATVVDKGQSTRVEESTLLCNHAAEKITFRPILRSEYFGASSTTTIGRVRLGTGSN